MTVHSCRIAFFDAKPYDRDSFNSVNEREFHYDIRYFKGHLTPDSVPLTRGTDVACIFVNDTANREVIRNLKENGVKLLALRCAGFNNVDLDATNRCGITVLRVPGYSPEAVAEHAMALALAVTRRIHKSYIKVRENNFSLVGLTGMNFYGKTAGIIGTGKIGAAMCRICHGFGMKVLAYDMYRNPSLDFVEYVDLDTLLSTSDLISLHCPLTDDSYHMICTETINKMKDNVILVNTSRGALIKTEDLITGNRNKKFFGIGLDVYEEETNNVFENREDDILESSITARLLSFPNVIVTSHQGFLTEEALEAISRTTLDNARDYENGTIKDINAV